MVLQIDIYSFHLLIWVLGLGSIKPNGGDEDEGEDEDLGGSIWKQLLNENDGVYSLKPWEEVLKAGANKATIGLACREVMRQAWSEYYSTANTHPPYLILIIII